MYCGVLQTLCSVVPKLTVGECAGGHRAENRHKSRDIMLQPRQYIALHTYSTSHYITSPRRGTHMSCVDHNTLVWPQITYTHTHARMHPHTTHAHTRTDTHTYTQPPHTHTQTHIHTQTYTFTCTHTTIKR